LTFRQHRSLAAWQLGEQRQFHPLHDRLNPSQIMPANQNLVAGEDQLEFLPVSATDQFCEHELIMRQQQRTLWRNFNA
jgi:hypothetical protein